MERSNAFREPSEASIRHLSEIDDPDLDILISSNNDVLRSRMLEEIQDHEVRPKSSGSFGSQVDSLYSSDSDPNKSIVDLKELLSPNRELPYRSRIDREYSGSPMGSFSSRVDSLYKSDPSQTSNLLIKNEIENDLKSLRLEADQELSYKLKNRLIYNEIAEMDSSNGSFSSQEDSLYNNNEPSDETSDLKRKLMRIISFRKETRKELNSVKLETALDITHRPRNGGIYNEITINIEKIMERLTYLSKKEESFTIDEAIEILDASHFLKVYGRPEDEILGVTLAGQMAAEGTILILQGEKLNQNGLIQLDQCKSIMLENLKPNIS